MTKEEWLGRAADEYVRQGSPAESASIEAAEIWTALSDGDRQPAEALRYSPEEVVREGIEGARESERPGT
ncbi:MAG TPA: hypothetical protein VM689_17015 [Aliidongia sp.]|nr:hypothetical protein [Aliidongia sp.]